MNKNERIDEFESLQTSYVETIAVNDGVECDVYKFNGDDTKDLGIFRVAKGCQTPLQRVLQGTSTIEGYLDGRGTLTVTDLDGKEASYTFLGNETDLEVEVSIGQTMQWSADHDSDLVFYEICTPPYQDGRFENL